MDLDVIWSKFISLLVSEPYVETADYKKIAGIPFLYITYSGNVNLGMIEKIIKQSAGKAMRGKQLHSETTFVREDPARIYVFRHRFYVPQRKMFCCGNLCPDCIRFHSE
ncbi:hypothetical protein [Peribacillus sp. SCS-155]|uniref:hypothetical protein n=1 Tax=Peribacillus sedimenti TaxID=3115297 RepID=UPI003905E69C